MTAYGFQHFPAHRTGLLINSHAVGDTSADPGALSAIPSLQDRSRMLNAEHMPFGASRQNEQKYIMEKLTVTL